MSELAGKRLVIACGGTGGHLFPGIAVAEEWRKRGGEVLLIISEKQIDSLASEGYDHLRFEKMPSVGMPRLLSLKMPVFLLKFFGSLVSCFRLIRSFRADAVVGMGGFTSTAPLISGRFLGLPTFIHESNAIPGRANRLNSRFARTVLVGFSRCAPYFGEGKTVKVVGTPLRPTVAEILPREVGLDRFELDSQKKTLLVMGGSQGARRINELVAENLEAFLNAGIQVLHISGPVDFEAVKSAYERFPEAGSLKDFCSEMQYALSAADLVVCRSGASSLTELSHYGLAAVLVPYPYAADDHQTLNAKIFSDEGAAQLWVQEELDEGEFTSRMIGLIQDQARLTLMAEKMRSLAVPDASGKVCDEIEATIRERGGMEGDE